MADVPVKMADIVLPLTELLDRANDCYSLPGLGLEYY